MEINSITAVITGASGQIGRAIALELSRSGCKCICHYHKNKTAAEQTAEQIKSEGNHALPLQADLTNPDDIYKLFDDCDEFDPPRILVNSAAIFAGFSLQQITAQNARHMLDINLISPVMVSASFAESVRELEIKDNLPVAKIVNLVDIGGIRPWANYTMYCASKAGLIAATKSMAKELAPAVCVNAVAPGVITWPENGDKEEYEKQVKMIPAGRIGTPEEIAKAVRFLIESDYITGQVLNVDGGRCI